jgi:hypothetical protein
MIAFINTVMKSREHYDKLAEKKKVIGFEIKKTRV